MERASTASANNYFLFFYYAVWKIKKPFLYCSCLFIKKTLVLYFSMDTANMIPLHFQNSMSTETRAMTPWGQHPYLLRGYSLDFSTAPYKSLLYSWLRFQAFCPHNGSASPSNRLGKQLQQQPLSTIATSGFEHNCNNRLWARLQQPALSTIATTCFENSCNKLRREQLQQPALRTKPITWFENNCNKLRW